MMFQFQKNYTINSQTNSVSIFKKVFISLEKNLMVCPTAINYFKFGVLSSSFAVFYKDIWPKTIWSDRKIQFSKVFKDQKPP